MNSDQPLSRRGNANQVVSTAGKPLLVIVEGSDIDAMIDIGLEAIGGLKRVIGNHKNLLVIIPVQVREHLPAEFIGQ